MSIENNIKEDIVSGILSAIGSDVTSIILYGSAARGTASDDSDIDIAVILDKEISVSENDRLTDIIVDMNLKYNKVFSVIDISGRDFVKWKDMIPFYRNVANEGVILWKAA